MSAMPETPNKPLITLPGPTSESAEGKEQAERRSHKRFPFTASAEVVDIHSRTRLLGRTSDLGAAGCYIDTLSPFAKGTAVRLRLEHDQKKFETAAVVAYSSAPMGMGLTFTEIRPDQLDILIYWMAMLNGEPSAEPETVAAVAGVEAETNNSNPRLVLYELINLMVRKKMITENEGAGLLRNMFH
jgi:PilZ domain